MSIFEVISVLIRALMFTMERAWIEYAAIVFAILIPKVVPESDLATHTLYVIAITAVVLLVKEIIIKTFNLQAKDTETTPPSPGISIALPSSMKLK